MAGTLKPVDGVATGAVAIAAGIGGTVGVEIGGMVVGIGGMVVGVAMAAAATRPGHPLPTLLAATATDAPWHHHRTTIAPPHQQ